ncbi:hypothetical protein BVI2075_570061 [Burkholderia vietnamiensis]|nr:hypothetical protein BVI2075_570061 [Burkholderia vietnamiensis]
MDNFVENSALNSREGRAAALSADFGRAAPRPAEPYSIRLLFKFPNHSETIRPIQASTALQRGKCV